MVNDPGTSPGSARFALASTPIRGYTAAEVAPAPVLPREGWAGNARKEGRMRRFPLLALGVVAFAVFLLTPTLRTGYLGDDSANSLIPGFMRYHGFGLPEVIAFQIGKYIHKGRFFPLAVVHGDIVFRLLPN